MLKNFVFISVVSFVLFTSRTALFAGESCVIVESDDCLASRCYSSMMDCGDLIYQPVRIIPTIETEKNSNAAKILADAIFGTSSQVDAGSLSCWGYSEGGGVPYLFQGRVCLDGIWYESLSFAWAPYECDAYIHGTWDVICSEDTDSDGVIDTEDNCPTIANTDQADQDNDGIGDVCDTEPYFFWPTLIEDIDVAGSDVPMENGIVYDSTRQVIIWTTKDPGATNDGLGWASRLGIAHSYVSYREVGGTTWSVEEETVMFRALGYMGIWSWVYPARLITTNGNYEIKLISEDSDGNRAEEVYTIEVAVP